MFRIRIRKFLVLGIRIRNYFYGSGSFHQQAKKCSKTLISTVLWLLKGTVSRDYLLLFFSWISFPPAPEYSIKTVAIFFKNSRRYSQVKVHHRCQQYQWQICTSFASVVDNRWQICHQCQQHQRKICRRCQRRRFRITTGIKDTGGKFAIGVNNTGGKQWEQLSNCWQLKMNLKKKIYLYAIYYPKVSKKKKCKFENVSDLRFFLFATGSALWAANISANFQKNSNRPYWYNQGLGGNWFMKKTRSKKSRDTVPLITCYLWRLV